jgi:bifunctional NMN adenylyltransferase/nudix hydrolase
LPLGDTLDSTQIRQLLFEGKSLSYIAGAVPEETLKFLTEFKNSMNFEQLVREYEFIQKYKLSWAAAPYDPIFVTTDAWVVQSGHVLLIQRKKEPGYGLWAAAGGFLGLHETLVQSMLRELREETKIKVPAAVLEGSIIDSHVFDAPGRSTRGRTITHSYLIKLKDNLELPHIKASDDAMDAKWVPLSEVVSDNMYEDHYDQFMFFKSKI